MSDLAGHPGFLLFAGALAVAMAGRRISSPALGMFSTVPALLALIQLSPGTTEATVAGFRLTWIRSDELSLLFSLVFAIVTVLGLLYGAHRMGTGETAAALLYAGAAISTVLAGDWITFFVFWELMAFAALALIWQAGTGRARRAGMRYLLIHAGGGALLFLGIALHLGAGGAMDLGALASSEPPFWFILTAVALNAAIPPLHAWLTDAYPEASTSGSVFLSAFTTKTAVYALVRLYPGAEILVPLGVSMALYGVVFAIIENDLRRLLAYHIVSQVGFMVTAVGLGVPLALNGAVAHAYSHILYKALLFMGAGAVIEATGRRRLSDLGGIASRMPFAVALYLVGAVSISGWPLFNGFISKSMIVSAAGEEHFFATELLLTLAACGTFLSVGLKLPWFAFFSERRSAAAVKPLPVNLLAAMAIAGGLCLLYGVWPDLLYRSLPFRASYIPYTLDHVSSSCQLLLGTACLFFLVQKRMAPAPRMTLDTDWVYRGPLRRLGPAVTGGLGALQPLARALRSGLVAQLDAAARRIASGHSSPRPGDDFSFRGSIGWTVFFAAGLVVALLWFLAAR